MRLCTHQTTIEAEDKGDGTVAVRIESDCKDVQHFAQLLTEVGPEDYTQIGGSKVWELAAQARLTPTCLIPTAVFNACWMETGMISKSLALKEKAICIHFQE